jgi:hypothetical protein
VECLVNNALSSSNKDYQDSSLKSVRGRLCHLDKLKINKQKILLQIPRVSYTEGKISHVRMLVWSKSNSTYIRIMPGPLLILKYKLSSHYYYITSTIYLRTMLLFLNVIVRVTVGRLKAFS